VPCCDCAERLEVFFSNVVPVALQGFKRLRTGCEAERNGLGSGNATVFHGTVQPLWFVFPGAG
jgi:hypothetical protein